MQILETLSEKISGFLGSMLPPQKIGLDRVSLPRKKFRQSFDIGIGVTVTFGGQTLRHHRQLRQSFRLIGLPAPRTPSARQITLQVSSKGRCATPLGLVKIGINLRSPAERSEYSKASIVHSRPIYLTVNALWPVGACRMSTLAQIYEPKSTG